MKKGFFASAIVMTALMLGSCCSINYPMYGNASGDIGTKVGEANSKVILGVFGAGGPTATLKDAANNGGIKTITHVERTKKTYFFGLVTKYTTRVYGN